MAAKTMERKAVEAPALPRTTSVPELPKGARLRRFTVADLFCGSGGFSTGASRALESLGHEMELTAINHWAVAVETHRQNHPDAIHYCQDLASVRPMAAVPEGRLDLLLASPSCTHFSRARGAKPSTDQQRMDPWYVITWLTELRVTRLILENVPEITSWGPLSLKTGRPIESRKGEYFRAWTDAIKRLGYRVDWKILNCADYGDPTTRQRFFLIARCDRKPLAWPVPTHSRNGVGDLFGAGSQRWRAASEVIDWSESGKSIYGRRKSLSTKTLLRILSGITRFEWHPGYARRLVPFILEQGASRSDVDEVIARSSPRPGDRKRSERFLLNRHGENGGVRAHDVREPMPTLDCRGAGYVVEGERVEPFIAVVAHGNKGSADNARRVRDMDAPLDTIHAGGGAFGLVEPGFTLSQASGGSPREVSSPMPAIVGAGAVALIAPYYGSGSGETCSSPSDPLPTVTSKGRLALVTTPGVVVEEEEGHPLIVPFYGASGCAGTDLPLPAVTGCGHLGMVVPLSHGGGHDRVRSTDEPLTTVTGANRGELGFITAAFGERSGQAPRVHALGEPVPTVCAQGAANLVTGGPDRDHGFDINFRMLNVGELARATSLDAPDKPYRFHGTKTEQIKQIGNAVPSRTAEALIRAMV